MKKRAVAVPQKLHFERHHNCLLFFSEGDARPKGIGNGKKVLRRKGKVKVINATSFVTNFL